MVVTQREAHRILPFARPVIGAGEKQAVLDVLEGGWITTGPRVALFEEQFAARVGARHAVAVNSATAALHLALEAIGVKPGDEVIVPTWTFAASAEVVVHCGGRPVLVDVDARTLNATPGSVISAITPRTRAVMAVHLGGLPVELETLTAELQARGIPLVEDAAHAFPSRIGGGPTRYAGTFGVAGAYSFYATKTITTGEGGMLVTDDDGIAERARTMALHGLSAGAWSRYERSGSWRYQIVAPGFKYNLTDIAAAMGSVQLERADEFLAARVEIATSYTARLAASSVGDLIELPAGNGDASHAWHLYIIRLDLPRLAIGRDQVIDELRELGVGTSVHFIPLHLHPYYQEAFGYRNSDLPVATREFERVISLPIWPGMSDADLDHVVTSIERVLEPARR